MKSQFHSAICYLPSAFALLAALALLAATPNASAQTNWGNALSFDGVDDYVQVQQNIDLTNRSFTVEAWARRVSNGSIDFILGQGSATTGQGLQFGFHCCSWNNQFIFGFYADDLFTTNAYTDTGWHHWAGTYDVATGRRCIYRDGSLVAADTAVGAFRGSGPLCVGKAPFGGQSTFPGTIDEVRIWNVARSASEIEEAMHHPLMGTESNLLAYWKFDEASGIRAGDATTNHGDGTLINRPLRVPSRWSPTLSIQGANPFTNECHTAFVDPGVTAGASPVAIAAGYQHSLGLKADGTVIAWGNGSIGQTNTPASATNVVRIAAGYNHNLALRANGTVIAWGHSGGDQTNVPAGLSNVVAIAGGDQHSLALKADGTVTGWGQTTVPNGLSNLVAIAAGGVHSLALRADSTVIGWGNAANPPAGLSNVVAISAGWQHGVALQVNGTVVAWGDNSQTQTNTPAGLSNVVAIAASFYHTLALKADGTVVGWGGNWGGLNIPADLTNVMAIAAGAYHGFALKHDGTVIGWGTTAHGQEIVPGDLSVLPLPVSVSGTVDTNTPATYPLTYSTTNALGAVATGARTVVVADALPPVLTLLGANWVVMEAGTPYTDAGATAVDLCGGDLTASIVSNLTVNPAVPGIYTNTLTVVDPAGHQAVTNRTVVVETARGHAVLLANDAMGTTAWTSGTNWTIAGAPSAANHYYTSTNQLRTPGGTANCTFGGHSLTLQPKLPGDAGGSMLDKSTLAAGASRIMTINNFTNAGGLLRSGGVNGSINVVAGNLFAISGNATLAADQTCWVLASPLVGDSTAVLSNTFASGNTISYSNDCSGYLGKLVLGSGVTKFLTPASAPGNPTTVMRDQLTLLPGAYVLDEAGINLNGANGGITLLGDATLNTANTISGTGLAVPVNGPYTLTKAGPGNLMLNSSINTAATAIAGGALFLGNGGGINSTLITIAYNAILDASALGGIRLPDYSTLAGGNINGNVSVTFANSVFPGGPNAAGTLTISGYLEILGGSTLNFDVTDNTTPGGSNDLIIVWGDLIVNGPVDIVLNGTPVFGTYTLFRYGEYFEGLENLQPPAGYILNNNTEARTIELVPAFEPRLLTWTGAIDGGWYVGQVDNWRDENWIPAYFANGDSVLFDDSSSFTLVSVYDPVFPSATTVSSWLNYEFAGEGIRSGSLTKAGSGLLYLSNPNSYSGPTLINGGTLLVSDGGSLGTGPVENHATLAFNRTTDLVMANPIHGSGSIINVGSSGTVTLAGNIEGNSITLDGGSAAHLVLAGSNSFASPPAIAAGYLHARNPQALGVTATTVAVQSGAQLFIDRNVDLDQNLVLGGAGPASDGALHKGGAGSTILSGTVTLTTNATINVDSGSTLNLAHASGLTGNANLTLAGSGNGSIAGPINLDVNSLTVSGGAWNVATGNAYLNTFLNGGSLAIADLSSLGPWPRVTFNGGVLVLTNSQTFNGASTLLTVATNGTLEVGDSNAVVTIAGALKGSGTFTHWRNTLVLAGTNTFAGTLNVDGGSATADDGVTRIASTKAIGNVTNIALRNSNAGYSTLELDGAGENIASEATLVISCRNNNHPAIQNLAGTNSLFGNISMQFGGGRLSFQSDAGQLKLFGDNQYVGSLVGSRTNIFTGAGDFWVAGRILAPDPTNGSLINLIKSGSGTLWLAGSNSYNGRTIVSDGWLRVLGSINSTGGVLVAGGTLSGNGAINDNVTIQPAGILAPGASADILGELHIGGNLVLAGDLAVRVNDWNSDSVAVSGTLTNAVSGNRVRVQNLGPALQQGEYLALFDKPVGGGERLFISGGGVVWANDLAVDGSISVVSTNLPVPVIASCAASGTHFTLNGGNAYAGAQIRVRSSTDLSAPLNTWTVETIAACDAGGNFSVSLPLGTEAQKFYAIQLFD